MLIEPNNSSISIVRQCQLLGLNRSVYYYQYKCTSEYTENIMRLIDERYTARPHEGSRKIMVHLNNLGYDVTLNIRMHRERCFAFSVNAISHRP